MPAWPHQRYQDLAAGSLTEMIDAVAALPPEDRAAASKGAGRATAQMTKEATERSQMVAAITVAVVLGVTPAQFLKLLGPSGTWLLSDLLDGDEREPFVRAAVALGPGWAAELVERCPRRVDGGLVDLLLELVVAHDLPMPALPSVWEMWVNTDALSLPHPGLCLKSGTAPAQ